MGVRSLRGAGGGVVKVKIAEAIPLVVYMKMYQDCTGRAISPSREDTGRPTTRTCRNGRPTITLATS